MFPTAAESHGAQTEGNKGSRLSSSACAAKSEEYVRQFVTRKCLHSILNFCLMLVHPLSKLMMRLSRSLAIWRKNPLSGPVEGQLETISADRGI